MQGSYIVPRYLTSGKYDRVVSVQRKCDSLQPFFLVILYGEHIVYIVYIVYTMYTVYCVYNVYCVLCIQCLQDLEYVWEITGLWTDQE